MKRSLATRSLTTLTALSCLALPALLRAQNTNDDAPTAQSILTFSGGGRIEIAYRQFTIAEGKTLKAISTGEGEIAKFFNETYIPRMLDGRIESNATTAIGDVELEAGKYRFAFRIDKDAIWNLDVYTDTGKETIGEGWQIEKGWWQQEQKLASIALDTKGVDQKKASRLVIQPVAAAASNEQEGKIEIAFGPLTASLSFAVHEPAAAAEASAEKGAVAGKKKGS